MVIKFGLHLDLIVSFGASTGLPDGVFTMVLLATLDFKRINFGQVRKAESRRPNVSKTLRPKNVL